MANLALSAATFDEEEPKSGGIIQRRKNKTHKNTNNMVDKSYYSNKVNDVLSKIHSQIYSDSTEGMDDAYGNFEPISRPTPMKTGKKETEEFSQMSSNPKNVLSQIDNVPTYNASKYEEIIDQTPNAPRYPYPDYEKHIQSNPNSYYRRVDNTSVSPNSNVSSNPNISLDAFPMVNDVSYNGYDKNNKLLMEKLNYMIHLLEETHDEQTNNVLEEVILYSFLGIFIIFLIDNFIKVGRYVR
jgi:hypothetical protein